MNASRQPPPTSYWLVSPLWDGLWLLSGLWLVSLLIVARFAGVLPELRSPLLLYIPLLLWGGHIISPMLTAWGNPAFRQVMLQSRQRYVTAPLCVLALSIVFGMLGDMGWWSLAPAVRETINPRYMLFFIMMVWNTWHFAGQHHGVLSIYRRTGNRTDEVDRKLDRAFTVILGCVLLPAAWYSQSQRERWGPLLDVMGSDEAQARIIALLTVLLSVVLTVFYAGRELLRDHRSIPRALYILSIGIQPVFAAYTDIVYQFVVFTVCHWLIALALSARISQRLTSNTPADAAFPRLGFFGRFHSAQVALLIVISVPLYYLLLRPASFGDFDPGVHLGYQLGETSLLLGLLSGTYFGITFVHFMYDRYVYSFRDPQVRNAIARHLF
jgi:hypothetical protein